MKRRDFLIIGSALGLSSYLKAEIDTGFNKEFKEVEKTIAAVQEHMFPEGSKLPSAKKMNTISFLFQTISHPAYDKDIRTFVIKGAQELMRREKGKFTHYSEERKESALREYEKTNYGKNWLSRIMTLTMEAIFSDPVYGSNIKEEGWKSVQSFGGLPRPKMRYIGL